MLYVFILLVKFGMTLVLSNIYCCLVDLSSDSATTYIIALVRDHGFC